MTINHPNLITMTAQPYGQKGHSSLCFWW